MIADQKEMYIPCVGGTLDGEWAPGNGLELISVADGERVKYFRQTFMVGANIAFAYSLQENSQNIDDAERQRVEEHYLSEITKIGNGESASDLHQGRSTISENMPQLSILKI